jgi:hypothetical protein
MTHVTQLTLTDSEVVFLANAATLTVVALKRHPDVQDINSWAKAMAGSFAATDRASNDTIASAINKLQKAAEDVPGLRVITHEPNEAVDSLTPEAFDKLFGEN